MARRRGRLVSVKCPVCEQSHKMQSQFWLYRALGVWYGYVTYVFCTTRGQGLYKLYDENYKYICWQQNTRNDIPDYEDIPF